VRFISTRELRINPGPALEGLQSEEQEAVITSHGKPVALLVGVTAEDLEDTVQALRRARAQVAVSRLRAHAQRRGLDALDQDTIDDEIRQARASRQPA
jgi:antitoxin (DNA-binding transcriptional repressor) of toxin-antitoxin stability system